MAGKRLERASESIANLFEQPDPVTSLKVIGTVPNCPLCGNWGYVNCPQAKAPNGHGDFIAIAFREGTACSCPAGAEFAKNQLEFLS